MPCLTPNPDRLYDLVPVVYRLRDAEQGYPLKALLRVIGEQVDVVEQDIAALYENWFIETCARLGGAVHRQPDRLRAGPRGGRAHAWRRHDDASGGTRTGSCFRGGKSRTRCTCGGERARWPLCRRWRRRPRAGRRGSSRSAAARDRAERELPASDARPHHRPAPERLPRRAADPRSTGAPGRSTCAAAAGPRRTCARIVWRLRSYADHEVAGLLLRGGRTALLPLQPAGHRYAAVHASPAASRAGRPGTARPAGADHAEQSRTLPAERDVRRRGVRRAVLLRRRTQLPDLGRVAAEAGPRGTDRAGRSHGLDLSSAARTGRGRSRASAASPFRRPRRASRPRRRACGCPITTGSARTRAPASTSATSPIRRARSSTSSARARRSRASPTP